MDSGAPKAGLPSRNRRASVVWTAVRYDAGVRGIGAGRNLRPGRPACE